MSYYDPYKSKFKFIENLSYEKLIKNGYTMNNKRSISIFSYQQKNGLQNKLIKLNVLISIFKENDNEILIIFKPYYTEETLNNILKKGKNYLLLIFL
jgi:hypothetical protein